MISSAGQLCIHVEHVLGRLRTAAGTSLMDRYFVACATGQFLADLRALCHGVCQENDWPDALSKLLHVPIPECCGYDLADLALIAEDGKHLVDRVGCDRPILIVGIRTGGSYLAPLWQAVLTERGVIDVRWCTVRPHETVRAPRLWECLLPKAHPEFIARLRDTPGLPVLPDDVRLQCHCPQGEVRYRLGQAWLPWNDPWVLNRRRPLVNPRKTPMVVCAPEGEALRPLLHLRFIGEAVFGRAEYQRVQAMDGALPAWFMDGYAITVDIGATRSFQEAFHAASTSVRADLLVQATRWLNVLTQQVIATTHHSPLVIVPGARWSTLMDAMKVEIPAPLHAFLAQPVPWPGRTGKLIRSSLRYACGAWHWQVSDYGDQGRLHRFQLEANWGDVSFPELELAAFALESRLTLMDAQHLAKLCDLAWPSVRESLSLAALMIAEASV